MECWLYDIGDTYRDRFAPEHEGTLWLAALGRDGLVRTTCLAGSTDLIGDEELPALARAVDAVPADETALVVPRRDAVLRPADRHVWHGIAIRVAFTTMLIDLVAVSERTSWSLRDELAAAEEDWWSAAEEAREARWND